MKNVTLVIYDYSLIGGAEKVALNLANEFSKFYNVTVVSVFAKESQPIIELNSSVNVFVLSDKPGSLTFNLLKYSKALRSVLAKEKDNVVISITAGLNTLISVASRKMSIKKIYAEHSNLKNNQYGLKHKFRQRLGARHFDAVVTLTDSDRKIFMEKYKLKEGNVFTIYNWVETPDNADSIKYDIESKTIVSVGRIVKVKGYDRVVRVANELFKEFPDWTWEIYGDGDDYDMINQLIKDNKLEKQLLLKGFSKDLDQVLSNKSIFVNTSTFEGFPISFLEARNYKIPIISFNCPTGPMEIINDKIDGLLIEAYDEEQMLIAIKELIVNPKKRLLLSSNIDIRESKFSKEEIMKSWRILIGG